MKASKHGSTQSPGFLGHSGQSYTEVSLFSFPGHFAICLPMTVTLRDTSCTAIVVREDVPKGRKSKMVKCFFYSISAASIAYLQQNYVKYTYPQFPATMMYSSHKINIKTSNFLQ